jgi:hypothetical protein
MADYPQTGSTLSGAISTGLSTQIVIKVDNKPVGAIQEISAPQRRSLQRVSEVGLDGILEIVPNKPTEYTISVRRIVFDKKRITEAFGRGFINIKAQLVPFDIDIIDRSGGGDGVVSTLKRCWFTDYTPKWTAGDFIISEDAVLWCEDVGTVFGGSEKFAAQGGIKPSEYSTGGSSREQDADTGKRRGSMDELGIYQITKSAFE